MAMSEQQHYGLLRPGQKWHMLRQGGGRNGQWRSYCGIDSWAWDETTTGTPAEAESCKTCERNYRLGWGG